MTDRRDTPSGQRPRLVLIAAVGVAVICLAAVAAVTVFRPARDEPAVVTEPEPPVSEEREEPVAATLTIADEADAVASLIQTSSSGWAAHITGIEVTTILRRPVIVVATDIGPEQAGVSDEFTSALSSFAAGLTTTEGTPYTYYLQIRSSEGDVIGAISTTDERWALDRPATPVDAGALRAWLDAVYGSGTIEPEAWLGRITDIDTKVDSNGNIVIQTDLDPERAADQQAAQAIIDAVNSSGATFARGVRVVFSDGVFEWSALLDGADPYAPQP